MNKKTILLNNESSFLSTGYAKYGKEVLSRLHSTGKYNIYEFGSYGHYRDARTRDIPWGFYGNAATPKNQARTEQEAQEEAICNSNLVNARKRRCGATLFVSFLILWPLRTEDGSRSGEQRLLSAHLVCERFGCSCCSLDQEHAFLA